MSWTKTLMRTRRPTHFLSALMTFFRKSSRMSASLRSTRMGSLSAGRVVAAWCTCNCPRRAGHPRRARALAVAAPEGGHDEAEVDAKYRAEADRGGARMGGLLDVAPM